MRKITMLLLIGIAVAAISAVPTTLEWESTELELGEIKANEQKELSFTFSNTGLEPIHILEAKGSCGCTVVEVPKAEIMPGSAATIKAVFTSGKTGVFRKNVKVKTSASEGFTYLYFSGRVVK